MVRKFRTGKCRPGIAFVQIKLPKKRPRRPEPGIKDGFEEIEHEFPLGIFRPENRTTFSDVPLLPEIYRWNDPMTNETSSLPPDFPATICKW